MLSDMNKYSQYGPVLQNQTPQRAISQINYSAQEEVMQINRATAVSSREEANLSPAVPYRLYACQPLQHNNGHLGIEHLILLLFL